MHLQWNGWKGSRVRAIRRDSRCAVCVADSLAKKKKRRKKTFPTSGREAGQFTRMPHGDF